MASNNGLTLQEWKSTKPESGLLELNDLYDWNQLVNAKFTGAPQYAVFYLDYGIRFARWENVGFVFQDGQAPLPEYLQLARIFNHEREFKIWQKDEAYCYRVRSDEQGKGAFAIDAKQFLWGTQIQERKGDWTTLTEERGTELCVPLKVPKIEVKTKLESGAEYEYRGPLVSLLTRNYIDYLDNGQSTYVDCRFVEFKTIPEEDVKALLPKK